MNELDNLVLDRKSFAWRDIQGQDKWLSFDPTFGSLTVVGATNYSGRLRIVGRQLFFQVKFSAGTSIASVAGTDYLTLAIAAQTGSLAGHAAMTNSTTNVAVGVCHIAVSTGRCYLPSQVASANVFNIAGWYEV